MNSSEYPYQKLPPPLEEYIPAQNDSSRGELPENNINRDKPPENIIDRKDYTDKELLDMLVLAAKDEREAQEYYGRMSEMARSEEERAALRQIRLDEQKHEKLFCDIYEKLTGSKPEYEAEPREVSKEQAKNYDRAFFEEINDVEFYRKIMFSFLNTEIRDMLYEIITDEQNHALKILYLR